MPNEQTSVPLYAASEILTAANMNISAGTGVPVFATTVTRDAAFGGANEKVLAEGQLCYLSATNVVQYYDGAAWATVGPAAASGLVLVANPTTFTASSAVQANNVFTSTYTNYLVMFTFASSATNDIALTMRLRAASTDTTTNYYGSGIQSTQTGTLSQAGFNAATSADFGDVGGIATLMPIIFGSPQAAARTTFFMENMEAGTGSGNRGYQVRSGFQDSATQFDGFSITPGSGTITGSFAVYGYSITV